MSATAESVAAILMVHPDTLAKDWKRRVKHVVYDAEARVFENTATGAFCTVYSLGQDIVVKEGNLLPKTDPELMKRLIKAGNAIKHCGPLTMHPENASTFRRGMNRPNFKQIP